MARLASMDGTFVGRMELLHAITSVITAPSHTGQSGSTWKYEIRQRDS